MGTKPRRAEGSEGRTMNPRDGPLWYEGLDHYRRVLVLAWAAGWFGTAGPPPAAPTQ